MFDEKIKSKAETRAWLACIVFSLVFILVCILRVIYWDEVIPLAIFFAIFIFNTFFSVRSFSRIISPRDLVQNIFDLVLAGFYILMAINVTSATYFVFFNLLIFSFSSIKYTLLLFKDIRFDHFLRNKILLNILGTCMSALTLGGIIANHVKFSLWAWVITFFLANIIIFTLWPFYRLDVKVN